MADTDPDNLPAAINVTLKGGTPEDLDVKLFERQETKATDTLSEVREKDLAYFNFKLDLIRAAFCSGSISFKKMLTLFAELDKCIVQRRHILGHPYGSPEVKSTLRRPVLPIGGRSSN